MAALFRGIYEHQLDDKNRLRIPAKFKSGLGESYSFARGMNGCIYVFPDTVLEETLEELSEERLGESSKASLLFFSSIFPAEEDGQGRVVLPARLRAMAGIKKDIVTIGRGKRLEIWSSLHWTYHIYFCFLIVITLVTAFSHTPNRSDLPHDTTTFPLFHAG